MTNPVKLLSDDSLREIESRPSQLEINGGPEPKVSLLVTERDALCETVRALRQQLEESDRIIRSYNNQEWATNTALREQLAETEAARDQLSNALSVRDAQLAQVTQERDELRNKLRPLDNYNDGTI